jgi:hypothetical protein
LDRVSEAVTSVRKALQLFGTERPRNECERLAIEGFKHTLAVGAMVKELLEQIRNISENYQWSGLMDRMENFSYAKQIAVVSSKLVKF